MNSKKNLVLLGMMGSGKSLIGSLLSKKLNKKFIDVDVEIEKKLDTKISEIFEINGEKYFRQIEEIETLKFLKIKKAVIALGGGAFLNAKIKNKILENDISFWLNWNFRTLINRIDNSKKRPVAYKLSKDEIEDLIKKRSIIYSKAMYKINCENLTKNEIVKKIINIYEAHQD